MTYREMDIPNSDTPLVKAVGGNGEMPCWLAFKRCRFAQPIAKEYLPVHGTISGPLLAFAMALLPAPPAVLHAASLPPPHFSRLGV
jgi:hypothetical protein